MQRQQGKKLSVFGEQQAQLEDTLAAADHDSTAASGEGVPVLP
jgi:hypothetical protein